MDKAQIKTEVIIKDAVDKAIEKYNQGMDSRGWDQLDIFQMEFLREKIVEELRRILEF